MNRLQHMELRIENPVSFSLRGGARHLRPYLTLDLAISVDEEMHLALVKVSGRGAPLPVILDVLQGGKVAKLEARIAELESTLKGAASAFETVEGIAHTYADKVFIAATGGK